jgi:hypothetical protein
VVARLRVHDTSQARPAEVFADLEVRHLPPRPARYDVPVFTKANVKRDHYVELGRALYSVPSKYIERPLDAHADVALIKLFCLEKVVRVHSRHRPGSRWAGLPEHTASDATSDLDSLRSAHPLHRRTTKSATAMTRSDSVLMGSELKQVLRTTGARPGARHPARPP